MRHELVRAIGEKRLIEFIYKAGRARVAEPHDYGIRNGIEGLLAFQIRGESRSGARGWKLLDVDHIRQLRAAGPARRRHAGR